MDLPAPLGPVTTRPLSRPRARHRPGPARTGRSRRDPRSGCVRSTSTSYAEHHGAGLRLQRCRQRGVELRTGWAGPRPGTQTPGSRERRALLREDVARGRPSATITPSAPSTTSRSTRVEPRLDPVLDHDQGALPRRSTSARTAARTTCGRRRVEHRGGLVEQQHARTEHQTSGQGQPLSSPHRTGPAWVVDAVREPVCLSAAVDRRPDLGARHLHGSPDRTRRRARPSRPTTAAAGSCSSSATSPGRSPPGVRRRVPGRSGPRAGGVAAVRPGRAAGSTCPHRWAPRAARAGRPRRRGRGRTAPAYDGAADARSGHAPDAVAWRRTATAPRRVTADVRCACRSAASRPAGSASMAPVAASARVSAQPPMPATTAPDSMKKPAVAELEVRGSCPASRRSTRRRTRTARPARRRACATGQPNRRKKKIASATSTPRPCRLPEIRVAQPHSLPMQRLDTRPRAPRRTRPRPAGGRPDRRRRRRSARARRAGPTLGPRKPVTGVVNAVYAELQPQ